MSTHRLAWVDAFADAPFGGNPCAVFFDADDIPTGRRIEITRETGLTECAFLVASDKADFGARYYLPTGEILFAGHPTIATCTALADAGLLAGRSAMSLEVGAGVIPIEITTGDGPPRFTMTQARPEFGLRLHPEEVGAVYGLQADEVIAQPQIVSTGTAFIVTLLRDHEVLRRARLDPERLAELTARLPGAPFLEPFLVTRPGATAQGQTFSRLLLPPPLPPEDPYTGSATGCMAAYLWAHGLIDSPRFVAEQGHWLERPGRGEVEVLGPRDAIEGVRLTGSGVVVFRGALAI
ncbi:MAG: PhzF family phenazine biosynthesis protein [Pikeienuella sp.]